MKPVLGIVLKLASTVVFAGMIVAIKLVGDRAPSGQVVFFRSFFALVPVFAWLAWKGVLARSLATQRPFGHLFRSAFGVTSMFMWFTALPYMPIAEGLAISYAAPLLTVAFAALLLGETVRIYRWTAVGVGFLGVMVMLAPHLKGFQHLFTDAAATGALLAFGSSFFTALAGTQIRRLTFTESVGTIVIYFSVGCSLIALVTVPQWVMLSRFDFACLVSAGLLGGVGQLLMTSSYRHAHASTVAPIEYVSMLWAVGYGFLLFGEVPGWSVVIGSVIVIAAGIFIVQRERALGLADEQIRKPSPPAGT